MQSLSRTIRTINPLRRQLSTASFAELFRKSVDNAPLSTGDAVQGHIVGAFRPRSTSSRFYIVDFGLKSEAPFTPRELPGLSNVGDAVNMPLMALEDDFNEPVFDQDRLSELPAIQAERFSLLTQQPETDARLLHGRFSQFNRGGATAKILGVDSFVPRHHVLVLQRPILGSFSPFYLLSMQSEKTSSNAPSIEVHPVVSSYGGVLFCLANLIGHDSAWEGSGGGNARQRLAYLRLLTKILMHKNAAVRRIISRSIPQPRSGRRDYIDDGLNEHRGSRADGKGFRSRSRPSRRADPSSGDTAWLNELPRGNWASSKVASHSSTIKSKSPSDGKYEYKKRRNGDVEKVGAKKTGPNGEDAH